MPGPQQPFTHKIPWPLWERLEEADKRRGGKQKTAIMNEALEKYLDEDEKGVE